MIVLSIKLYCENQTQCQFSHHIKYLVNLQEVAYVWRSFSAKKILAKTEKYLCRCCNWLRTVIYGI